MTLRHIALILVATFLPFAASASTLGEARPFNLVSFGGFSSNADINGRVAIQGTLNSQLTLGGSEIASNFNSAGAEYQSVFTTVLENGINNKRVQQNIGGNVYAPGYTASQNLITIQNGTGSVVNSGPSPIDWAYLQSSLTTEAAYIRSMNAFTVPMSTNVVVDTTGNTDNVMTNVQLFRLTPTQFANLTNIITNGKTVIIDIDLTSVATGATINGGNSTFSVNGQQPTAGLTIAKKVLFNFCGGTSGNSCAANTLNLNSGFGGAILAPNTTLSGNAQMNGQFIFGGVTSSGQIHGVAFQGVLPDAPGGSVPEPTTLVLTGSALIAALVVRQRTATV